MHVWLVGMMGSGKSVVGTILAKRKGVPFVDLDAEVEAKARLPIAEIFRRHGEPAFRALESETLVRVATRGRACVVATGGGAVLAPGNLEAMRASGRVVWLEAAPATIARRLQGSTGRPLLAGGSVRSKVASLLAAREPIYRRAADVAVPTDRRPARDVAAAVAGALDAPIAVESPTRHEIHVGSGLLARAGELLAGRLPSARVIVVADAAAARLHGAGLRRSLRRAGLEVGWIELPGGERSKHVRTMERLWRALVHAGADRKTAVIAFGGGVVGDLAGFAAATLLRGVPLVQIPTTLVAQVDSAIGGKTGFDLPEGKNLVGAFTSPLAVLADTEVLATLPERELRAGLGEVVKYGVIADPDLFEYLEGMAGRDRTAADLDRLVRRSAAIKAGVVSRDPLEKGERAILNFGHTVGHALEAAAGYRGVLHGEAVAAGMVAEARFAVARGTCRAREAARIEALVTALGLPASMRVRGAARFLGADKKRTGRHLRLPVLRRIGRVELQEVPVRDVRNFVIRFQGR